MESRTVTKTNQCIKEASKELTLTCWQTNFDTQYTFRAIYPLASGQLMAFCRQHTAKILDLNNSEITFTCRTDGLAVAKPLELPNASLYLCCPLMTHILHPETFTTKQSVSTQFMQLEKLHSLKAWQLLVGQSADEPKKLQVFVADQITMPIASVSIKEDTEWSVVNDTVVKLTSDHRIKLLELKNDSKFVTTAKLKYNFPEKTTQIIRIQPFHADDELVFTVKSKNKIQTYLLNVKTHSVQCFPNVKAALKMPNANYFLCIETSAQKANRVHLWNRATKKYEHSFVSENFHDVMQIAYTANHKPLLLRNTGIISRIETCNVVPLKQVEYKLSDNPFIFQGKAHPQEETKQAEKKSPSPF